MRNMFFGDFLKAKNEENSHQIFLPLVYSTRGQIGRFKKIKLIKIYLIGSNVSNFESRKKCKITAPYCTLYWRFGSADGPPSWLGLLSLDPPLDNPLLLSPHLLLVPGLLLGLVRSEAAGGSVLQTGSCK